MESLIKYVQDEYIDQKNFPEFKAGDTITVYYEIKEGDKSRTQFFKGVVIQIKGKGKTKTFTIRKMSGTFGIERIFPINLPSIKKIEVNKKGKVRRSRIYYFKNLRGKKARLKELKT
tara:strand:- start:336 stop:686 length:351 start_codon:yes stop_codon:yes gene_type:complete